MLVARRCYCCRLTTAVLQLLVIGLIAGGGTFFMRYHVATLRRADFSASEYFEDSKAGNGTRYRVVTSAADSGGSSCTLEVLTRATAPAYIAAYPGSGPEHSHRHSSERVVVRSGKLGWRRQRGRQHDEGVVAAGDAPLEFPAGELLAWRGAARICLAPRAPTSSHAPLLLPPPTPCCACHQAPLTCCSTQTMLPTC
jgi:hypothetical protein